jgi:hypothetical protein
MKKTLDRMTEIRKVDTKQLRLLATEKLKWLEAERQKGLATRQQYTQQIADLDRQLLRVDGAIHALTDLLQPKDNPVTETKES